MNKGICIECGAETWHRTAIRCKSCYCKKLARRTGSANPEWEKRPATRIEQGRDRALRRKTLTVCERCQIKPAVDRHHKDGNPLNNAPNNLLGLCRRCHMIVDGRLKKMSTIGDLGRQIRWNK